MKPTITAFADSPDKGEGMARDMRVRWALEEVGQPYDALLVPVDEMKEPAHLARHPFGQIPTYQEGGLVLFETGAIVLHIARAHPGLLPDDPDARERAITWLFAALSTMEPPVIEYEMMAVFERDEPWYAPRLKVVKDRIDTRLKQLSDRLGDAAWLDGDFSAGDLMMAEVLRRLEDSGLLAAYPSLAAYVARGKARPAFQRAFAAQRRAFEESRRTATAG